MRTALDYFALANPPSLKLHLWPIQSSYYDQSYPSSSLTPSVQRSFILPFHIIITNTNLLDPSHLTRTPNTASHGASLLVIFLLIISNFTRPNQSICCLPKESTAISHVRLVHTLCISKWTAKC